MNQEKILHAALMTRQEGVHGRAFMHGGEGRVSKVAKLESVVFFAALFG